MRDFTGNPVFFFIGNRAYVVCFPHTRVERTDIMANTANHLYTARTNGAGHTYSPPRVVITGVGALTPLGLDIPSTWENLLAGVSGIDTVTKFDTSELRTTFGGELKNFDPLDYLDRKEARRLDPYIQYAMVATQQALADSAIDLSQIEPHLVGVIIASGVGGIQSLVDNVNLVQGKSLRRISPFLVPNMLVDSAAGRIAIEYGVHGPNFAVVNACASGTAATGEAFELIRRGDADVMIVGGAEAGLMPITMAGFDVMGALSQRNDDPAAACRPFDLNRDGLVNAEGAGVILLESREHADRRGAQIRSRLLATAARCEPRQRQEPPTGRGVRLVLREVLKK